MEPKRDSFQSIPTDLSLKSPPVFRKVFKRSPVTVKQRLKNYYRERTEVESITQRDSAIRKAIAAISQSLPANENTERQFNYPEVISSSDEDVSPVTPNRRYAQESQVELINKVFHASQRKRKRSDGSISSSSSAQSPEFLNSLQESLNKNNNNIIKSMQSNAISVISKATTARPTHLNLSGNNLITSAFTAHSEFVPQSEWGKNTPSTPSPFTPSTPGESDGVSPTGKKRRRKLGPGRGWKFHDLSNDGGTKKKRAYAQNRLENEILQKFEDRVCVKTVASGDGTEKIVIVEPSEISDADLVMAATSLRLLFDKEKGIYKLQVLPYVIEEGLLSNREQVMNAVHKMLGDSGETLCPTAFTMMCQTGCSMFTRDMALNRSSVELYSSTDNEKRRNSVSNVQNKFSGKFSVARNKNDNLLDSKESTEKTDTLLRSLNNELVRCNNIKSLRSNRCMIWHASGYNLPHPGRKNKTVPNQRKWCLNCRNISTPL